MPRVYVSSVIPAAADRVWPIVRDFNGLPRWVPAILDSRIEQTMPADRIGCVRILALRDGGRIRERLLALSDYDYCVTYAILESPLGVADYVATVRLFPVTDVDATFVEWQAEFECAADRIAPLSRQIGDGVFRAGLDRLKQVIAPS